MIKDFSKVALSIALALLIVTAFIIGRITAPQKPPEAPRSPQKLITVTVNDRTLHITDNRTGTRYKVHLK